MKLNVYNIYCEWIMYPQMMIWLIYCLKIGEKYFMGSCVLNRTIGKMNLQIFIDTFMLTFLYIFLENVPPIYIGFIYCLNIGEEYAMRSCEL